VDKHLRPFFGGHTLAAIATPLVRQYVAHRQAQGASNATVNRDLITLKRIFSLAIQAGSLTTRPYIPLLKERNVRTGFFARDELVQITAPLPPAMRPVAEFAFVTGWRTPSEILPLRWRQVDFAAAEVGLDAGTTKNGEGRVFPMTVELRRILEDQRATADQLERDRGVRPSHVFCYTSGPRVGQPISAVAYTHRWWRAPGSGRLSGAHSARFPAQGVRNLVRAVSATRPDAWTLTRRRSPLSRTAQGVPRPKVRTGATRYFPSCRSNSANEEVTRVEHRPSKPGVAGRVLPRALS
jgi:integrase